MLTVGFAAGHVLAQKYVIVVIPILHHAQAIAHAILAYHGLGELRCLLNVPSSPG